ncbi:hypothetical protein PUND_a2163 [Pseudoalteromonas undina]|uniref:DUF805 domain-containing protein n=1 Tax=Pseudoalteromonas undina TaxID=43660 RepID=A0ABN0NGE0_9GAMM|nr:MULTISPECIES: DUF805 domain-containing protein [Pseudoalteromonas]OLF80115.1 hypothetical protein AWH60_01675 [Pseudoalteromonas haloplanktis]KAF7766347.1 hypothetical protein PUND_a2163 [Pseudoalteromonas undina]KPH92425.1 hypothetical protein AMS57_02570 [Pseudoalteromonas undina]KPZ65570.1 Inner membrane protein YhaH [Pseudoalteromonas sp. P1-16-1b]MCK8125468.1 DUF805 domain-containing protein [Pseudoalteromonas sp. 2CM39R]|tara:strand:+ start:284 stop:643 length:360 start_codon:yes stop_codon:yes gene_type:complete
MEHYMNALRSYADFSGRNRRKAFWMFMLINLIFSLLTSVIDGITNTMFVSTIYSLALLIPQLSAGARRLHDTNRSGWWQLLWLVPVIGWIILIIFLAQDSQEGENDHGANPKEVELHTA